MALYIVYEYGRFNAGYDRLAAAQQRTELEVEIERLNKSNRELRTQLAELDTIRIGRAREQAEVTRTIGDLQAQVAKQTQELAFYRGIVAQGAAAVGVKVQQVHITAGTKAQQFMVHIALVRSVRPDTVAVGSIALSVDGATADGKPRPWTCQHSRPPSRRSYPSISGTSRTWTRTSRYRRASSRKRWRWKCAPIRKMSHLRAKRFPGRWMRPKNRYWRCCQ